jgi:uncharacterized protein
VSVVSTERSRAGAPIVVHDVVIRAGERRRIDIPVVRRYTHTDVSLSTYVVHGKEDGPRIFLSAAIHGDEINGVEIIRRVLKNPALKRLKGAVLAVPVVNVLGFSMQSRYLPDRRDLNRFFPGSQTGSLASRIAYELMSQIVSKATLGIDFHTGSNHRTNLPQVRACLDDEATARLARAFGAPVILDANVRDGSLREAVQQRKIPSLLYEGGEALRFDEFAIRDGVRGVLNVMRSVGMLPPPNKPRAVMEPFVARSTAWARAPDSGLLRHAARLGARVDKGQLLGVIGDPLGDNEVEVRAAANGLIIGHTNLPLVNEGDALFHIATFDRLSHVEEQLIAWREELSPQAPVDSLPEPPADAG